MSICRRATLTETFRGFSHPLHENAVILTSFRPLPLSSRSCPIHFSLIDPVIGRCLVQHTVSVVK